MSGGAGHPPLDLKIYPCLPAGRPNPLLHRRSSTLRKGRLGQTSQPIRSSSLDEGETKSNPAHPSGSPSLDRRAEQNAGVENGDFFGIIWA